MAKKATLPSVPLPFPFPGNLDCRSKATYWRMPAAFCWVSISQRRRLSEPEVSTQPTNLIDFHHNCFLE